jgi:DNA repair exonuclease SbcCD ATPase subunit
MIIFETITYKNFLATGNNAITINLNKNKSTLIVGHNGAGKSTILDALSFALFGKPHRSVSKVQLINSVNGKNALVTISFKTAGHNFKIVRGIKPNIFEIYKNDELIDQSSNARDYQKFLEQNILKLNHKSFHQIVVLGSSSFVPFMALPPQHRREVIEDLLDINIFSKMKGILKEKSSVVKSQSKDLRLLINSEKDKIVYQKKHIERIKALNKTAQDQSAESIELLNKEKQSYIDKGTEILKEIESTHSMDILNSKLKNANSTKSSLILNTGKAQNQVKSLVNEAKFFEEHESCPTCQQLISSALKLRKINDAKVTAKGLTAEIQLLELSMTDVCDNIATLSSDVSSLTMLKQELKTIKGNIKKIEGTNINTNIVDLTSDYKDLKKAQNALEDYRDLMDEYNEKSLYNEVAHEMLKDTGIRTKVVKEYLPAMNMLINKYLQTLEFFVSFNLTDNFDEIIRSRHRDTFVYANFSEGEKQRIDLSLLFAWRQIAKMKNSTNTNLLILDETFDSSLDTDGVDNLMKILYSLDENTNTFVISHKPDLLESKLESKIQFTKINNFSSIS